MSSVSRRPRSLAYVLLVLLSFTIASCSGDGTPTTPTGSATPTAPSGPSVPAPTPSGSLTVSCDITSLDLGFEGTRAVTCVATSVGGFAGQVQFLCGGVPAGVTCQPRSPSATLTVGASVSWVTDLTYTDRVAYGQSGISLVAKMVGTPATMSQPLQRIDFTKNGETVSRPCPSIAEVAQLAADLKLQVDFDPTGGRSSGCKAPDGGRDLTILEAQVYRALSLARHLQFDQPLPWTNEPLYVWLTHSIKAIRFRTGLTNSFCCEPADTINLQVDGNILLQPMQFNFQNLVHFLGLVVHEARHNNGFPHTCGVWDRSRDELGAWAAHHYYWAFLADHINLAIMPDVPYYQGQFRAAADGLCQRAFCNGCR